MKKTCLKDSVSSRIPGAPEVPRSVGSTGAPVTGGDRVALSTFLSEVGNIHLSLRIRLRCSDTGSGLSRHFYIEFLVSKQAGILPWPITDLSDLHQGVLCMQFWVRGHPIINLSPEALSQPRTFYNHGNIFFLVSRERGRWYIPMSFFCRHLVLRPGVECGLGGPRTRTWRVEVLTSLEQQIFCESNVTREYRRVKLLLQPVFLYSEPLEDRPHWVPRPDSNSGPLLTSLMPP